MWEGKKSEQPSVQLLQKQILISVLQGFKEVKGSCFDIQNENI